jgi:transcriptional regulator GlxA family with amidase domain
VERFSVPPLNHVSPKKVAILGFDGVRSLDLTGPLEALTAAKAGASGERTAPCYAVRIVGIIKKSLTTESGLILTTHKTIRGKFDIETVIIPGGQGLHKEEVYRRMVTWLTTHSRQIRRIVAVSDGIYPLAQSGLIDGRRVATHWKIAKHVAQKFPSVRVDQTASFIKDGPFYTSGGGTHSIEMILALIEEDFGRLVALSVARELVMRLRPFGDRDNFADQFQFDSGPEDRLADLPAWIGAHLNENLTVETLAERACLCPRHFRRLFRKSFNISPAAFVERLRIDEARRRLLVPTTTVDNVAAAVGFKNTRSFRRAFERCRGMSPTSYRRGAQGHLVTPTIRTPMRSALAIA